MGCEFVERIPQAVDNDGDELLVKNASVMRCYAVSTGM